jgi:hypothetical protein
MSAEIKNWKEVQEQFGFEMARKISKELNKRYLEDTDFVCVPCVERGEAVALFELVEVSNAHYYEYTGTAN